MNRHVRVMALCSVLTMMAVGCQKEEILNPIQDAAISENGTVYTVQYAVDGVLHQELSHSKQERTDLFHRLFALAREGKEICVSSGEKIGSVLATKDVVIYSTTIEDDAIAWAEKMIDGGYRVTIKFDAEKKVYNCTARR